MASVDVPLERVRFGQTKRKDAWWLMPLVTFVVFSSFVVYVTWALLQGDHYHYGNYLSPLYSPELFGDSPHAVFGKWRWPWLPFVKYSPAMLILIFPLAFRMTCYYYRGAYYKAFWMDPVSCTVGEPRKTYWGERTLPLILQNVHRYFAYAAVLFLVVLTYDVWLALWFTNPATGQAEFGIGVGTIILAVNVTLLSSYTLGCHSIRHLVGGVKDEVSKSPMRHACYNCSSALNGRHMLFAWCSLFSVALSDVYVRLCSMGIISDTRLF